MWKHPKRDFKIIEIGTKDVRSIIRHVIPLIEERGWFNLDHTEEGHLPKSNNPMPPYTDIVYIERLGKWGLPFGDNYIDVHVNSIFPEERWITILFNPKSDYRIGTRHNGASVDLIDELGSGSPKADLAVNAILSTTRKHLGQTYWKFWDPPTGVHGIRRSTFPMPNIPEPPKDPRIFDRRPAWDR